MIDKDNTESHIDYMNEHGLDYMESFDGWKEAYIRINREPGDSRILCGVNINGELVKLESYSGKDGLLKELSNWEET